MIMVYRPMKFFGLFSFRPHLMLHLTDKHQHQQMLPGKTDSVWVCTMVVREPEDAMEKIHRVVRVMVLGSNCL